MNPVLVIGATGKIGSRLLESLSRRGISSKAFSRQVESATLPALSVAVPGDLLDIASLERALEGVDKVFLLWPFLSAHGAEAAIEAIARRAPRLVYLSTAGAGDAVDRVSNPISAVHYAIENMIERTVPGWTFLRPLGFASNALLWADQIRIDDKVTWPYAGAGRSLVHDADVADVATEALLHEGLIGKRMLLTGPETLNQREQVATIGDVIGRELSFQEEDPAVAREKMLAWGLPVALVDGVLTYLADRVADPEPINSVIQEITGRSPRTFRSWVAENAAAFADGPGTLARGYGPEDH